METATQEKKSSFDLVHDKRTIEAKIEELLHQHDGEITEEVDELLNQLTEINDNIVDKIKSLSWARKKIEAEIASIKAKEDYWKQVAEAERKARLARENNLDRVKDLAVLNLRSLDEESIRIDGKKVYLRDFYKVTINDENRAYTHLHEHGLAHKQVIVEGNDLDELDDAINDGDREKAQNILQSLDRQIVIAGGKELNNHGKELHETYMRETEEARKRLAEINDYLNQPDQEESEAKRLQKEKEEILEWMDKVETANSIPGGKIEVSKSVYGL